MIPFGLQSLGVCLRVLVVSLCFLGACGDDSTSSPSNPEVPRGIRPNERTALRPAPAIQASPPANHPAPNPFKRPPTEVDQIPAIVSPQNEEASSDVPAVAPEPEPTRDLSAELREQFGDPAGCMAPTHPSGHLFIGLHAVVSTTGIITRSTVSGANLSSEEQQCLAARLTRIHLSGPIPDAPQSVDTQVELARQTVTVHVSR